MTDPARPARSTSDTLFMPKAKPSGLRDSRGGWTLSPDLREQVTRRLRLIALMYSLAFFFADVVSTVLMGGLRERFAAIGRVRPGVGPPFSARTEALSTTPRDQSIWSAACSAFNNTRWIFFHTPATCQSCSRRQHDIPDPHPISLGSISHGIPLLRTYTMPVSAARSRPRERWRSTAVRRCSSRKCRHLERRSVALYEIRETTGRLRPA